MENSQRRVFFRRSRKGKVVRVVDDKYLRSDVGAGYHCGVAISPQQLQDFLQMTPDKELLVIDTNIALHEIDVLEFKCPATACVAVPQTVLQELRHLNLSVFHRLKALITNTELRYVFFPNEVCEATSVRRELTESINDANDRAIRTATSYLHSLVSKTGAKAVLITADKDCQKRARSEGILCKDMKEHLQQFMEEYPELSDLLSASEGAAVQSQHLSTPYPAHLSIDAISSGLRSGKVLRGSLRVVGGAGGGPNSWQRCYAVVHSKDSGRRFYDVSGPSRVNRAVDGDLVALEICGTELTPAEAAFDRLLASIGSSAGSQSALDSSAACAAKDTLEASAELEEGIAIQGPSSHAEHLQSQQKEDVEEADDTDNESSSTRAPERLCARVVGIIRRNWRQYAGSLSVDEKAASTLPSSDAEGENVSCLFRPVDGRIPFVRLSTRRYAELRTKRFLTTIDSWPADSAFPLGHYVHTLGNDGDKSVETQVLLHEFDVPHAEFTAEVMACLPPPTWKITDEVVAERTDLRHLPVVSIDPPGCKDIDDALHCIRLPNGRLEVGVHIADVTYFVHPDTPLDKEAAHRATSTYLVERRLDMLPTLLTTELCSLRSKEDHLAFSVLWEFDDDGNIHDVRFCKSVIHSVASLTYDEAQAMLDAPSPDSQVAQSVLLLNKLARILRQRRIDMGALTLASPEVRFKLDQETQNPTDVSAYALKEANALVEEWMLLGNITVSKKILRHYPTLGLLRRHQPPSREQFEPLVRAALAAGVFIDISSSKTLADSLDLAVRPEDPFFNKLLRIMSTRCMMPAQYFCSGEVPKDQWHHYGLAAPVYTHFTSPIRRYADVIVHRLLASAIGVIPLPAANADRARQQELCSHLNRRHKAAQYVQRASVTLHTLLFFRGRPADEAAYVLSINADTIVVLAPRFGIEGQISVHGVAKDLGVEPVFAEGFQSVQFGEKMLVEMFQKTEIHIRVVDDDGPQRRLLITFSAQHQHRVHLSTQSKPADMAQKMKPKTLDADARTGNDPKRRDSESASSKEVSRKKRRL